MKLAIAHDWLTNIGGAEIAISIVADIYENAPIYTSVYDPDNLGDLLKGRDIRTSFIQKFKKAKKNHQKYLPFMPTAWEQFNFNEFDVVFSSSTSCAKGLITSPNTMHICYCNTPMRYAWEFYYEYMEEWNLSWLKKKLLPYVMHYIRMWDAISANRVDYFIANSKNVAKRINKHYRREAEVIYAPVQSKFYDNTSDIDEEYFLIVSRLVPYKKVDLAVEAFNELGLPLVVIGGGPQLDYIKKIAKDNVKVMGRQPDEVVMEHYAKCRAFIFPGEEDLGLTPLEVQASGRPVIAFGKGGATETVLDQQTGLFFKEQTVAELKNSVKQFMKMSFDKSVLIKHSEAFSETMFKEKIKNFVDEKYEEHKTSIYCR
ncbi:MAG: glycosyltransferase [Defluviitaleaceae bacterium]|nr:glycosyltransferase [Defluviitaleaceae bacterium]